MNCKESYAQSLWFQLKKRTIFSNCKIFFLLFVLLAQQLILLSQKDQIKINQVGYYPISSKLAIISGKVPVDYFSIVTADGKDTLSGGDLGREMKSAYSSTITRIADFTSFKKTGDFVLRIRGSNNLFHFASAMMSTMN